MTDQPEATVNALSVLIDISEALSDQTELAPLLGEIVGRLISFLHIDAAGVALLNRERSAFELVEYQGVSPDFLKEAKSQSPDSGVFGLAIKNEKYQVIEDVEYDPRVSRGVTVAEGFKSAIAVPLLANGRCSGALTVFSRRKRTFGDEVIELVRAIGRQLAIGIENARLQERNTRNIRDLERAYRELELAKDRLIHAEKLRSLGEMAAGVAHDFNNILSAILGRAQMLKFQVKNPEILRAIQIIETAALDGAHTVRRIQEFARSESEEPFETIDLNRIVKSTLEQTAPSLEEADVAAKCEYGEDPCALGSESELREVLTNLVTNARDAMPDGGQVSIRTGNAGNQAYVEVEDQGRGISEDVKSRIFDPFFTTKGRKGTGLGLSVSYSIIKRHGGTISVDSALGQGTLIRIVLPKHGPKKEDTETPSVIPRAPIVKDREHAILLVDDDDSVREVLSEMLTAAGFSVTHTDSGKKALELFDSQNFHLVLTDLGMNEINGWELAEAIKRKDTQTPVCLITGWGAHLENQEINREYIDAVMEKPFRYQDVLSTLEKFLVC